MPLDSVAARKFRSAALAGGLAQCAVPASPKEFSVLAREAALNDSTGLVLMVKVVDVALHFWEPSKDLGAALAVERILVRALARRGVIHGATAPGGTSAARLVGV